MGLPAALLSAQWSYRVQLDLGISRPTLDKKSEGYGLTVARRRA